MRKKSAKKAAERFKGEIDEIRSFVSSMSELGPSENYTSWIHELAIIRLYRAFEGVILDCLVAAINNDTRELSKTTDVHFPKHLSDEVCNYIIVGDGYFNFPGREGLVREVKKFLPSDHYLVNIVKEVAYKVTLERLFALRNFAAHNSQKSKKRALTAVNQSRISTAGAWLKKQGRLAAIADDLEKLADKIADQAPF